MPRRWLVRALSAAGVLLLAAIWPRPLVDRFFWPESQVLAANRIIHTAQTEYYSQHGCYAVSLRELAPLLRYNLASGDQSGYRLTLQGTPIGYSLSAVPEVFRARSRTFYSDQTMVVHEHYGPEPATAQDPESK